MHLTALLCCIPPPQATKIERCIMEHSFYSQLLLGPLECKGCFTTCLHCFQHNFSFLEGLLMASIVKCISLTKPLRLAGLCCPNWGCLLGKHLAWQYILHSQLTKRCLGWAEGKEQVEAFQGFAGWYCIHVGWNIPNSTTAKDDHFNNLLKGPAIFSFII